MDLDERKKQILGAVIESYIQTAEPVGSRTISKISGLDVSPATIRNEMSDLEEMGLLEQPHTSAGRVPSQLGYRVYVDRLMKRYRLTAEEISRMKAVMELKIGEFDKLIKEMARIYSHITNYTVVGMAAEREKSCVRSFQLLRVSDDEALLILLTDKNVVNSKRIHFDNPVSQEQLDQITFLLNTRLTGLSHDEISLSQIMDIEREMEGTSSVLMPILSFVSECIATMDASDVFVGGTANLFNFPEYRDVERAREMLEFLDNKQNIQKVTSLIEKDNVTVIIGSENGVMELRDCSIVLSPYKVGGKQMGTIGLIGPTRMNYSKAVSQLEFFTKSLNELLDKKEERNEQEG